MAQLFRRNILQQIDQPYRNKDFNAISKLLNNVDKTNKTVSSTGNNLPPVIQPNADKYQRELYLHDINSGPISQGIKALEALSRIMSGVEYSSLLFFNTPKIYSNSSEIRNATDDELIIIVYSNLALQNYVPLAEVNDSVVTSEFFDMCLVIGKQVRSGSFHLSYDARNILIQSKKIVKLGSY